jgi:hypothetical protein
MTKNEYKEIEKAVEKLAESIIKSLDKYNKDIEEVCKATKRPKKRP